MKKDFDTGHINSHILKENEERVTRMAINTRWESMIPLYKKERPLLENDNQVNQIQDAITWAESEDLEIIILGGRESYMVSEQIRRRKIGRASCRERV